MTILLLISIVIICILVFLMFIILKSTVKKINTQSKLYFVDKVQEYDYMIDEKLNKLNEINKEIEETNAKKIANTDSANQTNYDFDYQIIDLLNKTEYHNNNVFELTKKINEKFTIDYVGIIKEFINTINDDKVYNFCLNLKNKFTSEVIYDLKILSLDEQIEYLEKELTNDEFKIFKLYQGLEKKVTIDGFIDYIDELTDLNDPSILVCVGNKEENYDYLSKYVKTIYSKDIYKGIKIIYRKKIYDYSLNEGNV